MYLSEVRNAETSNAREWVADWIQREGNSNSYRKLAQALRPDSFDSEIEIAQWKRTILSRIATHRTIRNYLPTNLSRALCQFGQLVTALQQRDTIDDVDLLETSGIIEWDETVELSLRLN